MFVEELTKSLAEAGRLSGLAAGTHDSVSSVGSVGSHDSTSDSWARLTVPDSLQDLLTARLDRLGGNNIVVQMAAAIGPKLQARISCPQHWACPTRM